MRSEHKALYGAVNTLAEDVDEWHHKRELLRFTQVVAERLQTFHADLREHERRESELVLAAYDDDIGVGD